MVVMWILTCAFLFYAKGTGDHDAFLMAAGILRGARTDRIINEFDYSPSLQYLYYYLLHPVAVHFSWNAESILLFMNYLGAVCSLLIPILLAGLIRHLMPDREDFYFPIFLFMASPVYLLTASHGHPFSLSLVLSLSSFLLLLGTPSKPHRLSPYGRLAAAIALQSVALMVRFEQPILIWSILVGVLLICGLDSPVTIRSLVRVLFPSLGAFFFVQAVVMSSASGMITERTDSFAQKFELLLLNMQVTRLARGAPYWLTELSVPLLIVLLVSAVHVIRRSNTQALLGLAIAVLPGSILYLGNPNPPRHLYAVAIAITVIGGLLLPRMSGKHAMVLITSALAFNLSFPWSLIPFDGYPYPQRANVTFNAIEKTHRNKKQFEFSHAVYERLLIASNSVPVVALGNFIHIAQLFLRAAGDPEVVYDHVELAPGVFAHHLSGPRMNLYIVEAYYPSEVNAYVAQIRAHGNSLHCVSLIRGARIVNDLHLMIPEEINWWSVS